VNPQTISKKERKTEAELEKDTGPALPRILGCLLEVVAGILANPADRPEDLERMADFSHWIHRAIPALGWEEEKFAKAYAANIEEAALEIAAADVWRRPSSS
jgi:hypothetical protein